MIKYAKYPLFLSLEGKIALIIGFGKVGQRKLKKLFNCGLKKILVLDLLDANKLTSEQTHLLAVSNAIYECRNWNERDISAAFIIFACTDDFEENKKISKLCENKLCNNVTEPDMGNFIVPATLSRKDMQFAISTGENSPALAALTRKSLEPIIENYTDFSTFLGQTRGILKLEINSTVERQKILRSLVNSDFPQFFLSRDFNKCVEWLKINIQNGLAKKLMEMLPK